MTATPLLALVILACEVAFLIWYIASWCLIGLDCTDERMLAPLDVSYAFVAHHLRRLGVWLFLVRPESRRISAESSNSPRPASGGEPIERPLSAHDLIDIAMRQHTALGATIDALNAGAFAVLVLPITILVFVIDKFDELMRNLVITAGIVLFFSVCLTIYAFVMGGAREWRQAIEIFDLRRFMIGYSNIGRPAISDAFDQLVVATELMSALRDRKRYFLWVAVILCLVSGSLLAASRFLDHPTTLCNGKLGAGAPTSARTFVVTCQQ
jgi:hypothetical protein